MKIVKIFGLVLAAHIVPLTIFLLIQGCQTTPRTPAPSDEAAAAAPAPVEPVSENWSSQSPQTYAAPAPDYAGVGAPLTGPTPAERNRAEPTRPANPEAFFLDNTGSMAAAPEPAAPTTYTVRAGDSLWRIAKAHGITVRDLQKANPKMKGDSLKPGQTLNLPAGAATVPGGTPAAARVNSAAATSTYSVRAGDTLSKIAARNGTTVSALREVNGLTSDLIQVGQQLVIPTAGMIPAAEPARPPASVMTVTVMPGETLGAIARRFSTSVQELMQANNITDARRLRAGDTLVIPGYDPVGTGVVPPSPPPQRPAQPAAQPPPTPAQPQPEATPPTAPEQNPGGPEMIDAPVIPVDDPVPAP